MKKIVKMITALLMCLVVMNFSNVTVNAATSVSASGSSTVQEGDTFTVTIAVSSAAVTSGSVEVKCSSSLEIVSGKWLLSGTTLAKYDSSTNKGAFAFSSEKSLKGNYFQVTLRAKNIDKAAKVTVTVQLKNGDTVVQGGSASKSINIICKNHSYGEYTTVEPTCTKDGSKSRTCSVCGTVDKQAIPALGHDVKDYTVITEPTCTEKGKATGKCARCGNEVTKAIDAKGHNFGSWTVTKESTCTEQGEQEHKCYVCGYVETQPAPLAEHVISEEYTVLQEADLAHAGVIEGHCVNCGATMQTSSKCEYEDKEHGLSLRCDEGAFREGTVIHIEDAEANGAMRAVLDSLSGKYELIEIYAEKDGQRVDIRKAIEITLRNREGFGNNTALLLIDEDGSYEILGTKYSAEEGTFDFIMNRLGKIAYVDLEVIPESKKGLPEYWKYAAYGAGGVALLFFVLFLLKAKKNNYVIED